MFKNLKITCDQATTICDKNQYSEASLLERVKLGIHLIRCKVCDLYTKQNCKMTKVYDAHASTCKGHKPALTSEEKEAFKKSLKETNF